MMRPCPRMTYSSQKGELPWDGSSPPSNRYLTYRIAACGACGRGYAQQDANRKLSYQEWHNLGIRDGTDVEQEVGKLDEATTRRLANGIVGADDLQHPQTAIAAAKAKISRCQPAEAKAADVCPGLMGPPTPGRKLPAPRREFLLRSANRADRLVT